jgi:hypothetical protein
MPALWALDRTGIDLPAELPDVTSITLGTLPRVVETLLALATPEALERHAADVWRRAEEQVRTFYLRPGLRGTLATMFRLAPRSSAQAPPERFVEDRVHDASFEVAYRIEPVAGPTNLLAPGEEASVVLYPFHPALRASPPAGGSFLEVFAYDEARDRHRSVVETIARENGWRVEDPAP